MQQRSFIRSVYSLFRPAGAYAALVSALATMLLWFVNLPVCAQSSSRGRDFVLTFPPNYHDEAFDNRDSLYIFVATTIPTNGEIHYRNRYGQQTTHTFAITDPASVYTFAVPAMQFELAGFNNNGVIPSFNEQNEQVALQSFHVKTDADVAVYAMSRSRKSSDAFLVLPLGALGKHYRALTYNSNGRSNGPVVDGFSTPSQLAIVATENNTIVDIAPSQPTWEYGMEHRRIELQAGECYLVQAEISRSWLQTDLSGTRITASRPVAVFASHQRATIPIALSDKLRTRNYLIEQLPPVETWGYRAIATPYPPAYSESAIGYDVVRVLALYDSTAVHINGMPVAVLRENTWYEQPLQQPLSIEATSPILVAQYKRASRAESEPEGQSGDPFMQLIPPEEQFMKFYRFISPQIHVETLEPPLFKPVIFQEQYATVVIPAAYAASLRIDGAAVASTLFQPVPGTTWVFAHIPVSDGVHSAEADAAFGLYVYGYGEADAYGYIGGTNAVVIPKDLTPPGLSLRIQCTAAGTAYDSTASNSGIRSIEAPAAFRINTEVQLPDITAPFPATASFSATLIDPYQDGSFRVIARDSARLATTQDIVIYGFTVEAAALSGGTSIEEATRIQRDLCVDIAVRNYGSTTHTITAALADPRFWLATATPLILEPGAQKYLRVCFNSSEAGLFRDTLVLSNPCSSRHALALAIEAVNDTAKPQFTAALDTCAQRRTATIAERLPGDWGLQSVRVLRTENTLLELDSNGLPTAIDYRAALIDPNQDGIVEITAIDEAGNELHLVDTIQGRTLRAVAPQHNLGNAAQRISLGDSIEIYNAGLLPAEITSAVFRNNVYFSAPLSQFPIGIPPKQSRFVQVVFVPDAERQYTDTIDIDYACASIAVAATAQGRTPGRVVSSGCGVRIVLSALPMADLPLLTGYPNPADKSVRFRITAATAQPVVLRLYTMAGAVVHETVLTPETPGVYDIGLDTSGLQSGMYTAVVNTGHTLQSYTVVIKH